jgi:hypothetical protein
MKTRRLSPLEANIPSPSIEGQAPQCLTQKGQVDSSSLVTYLIYDFSENTNPGPGNYESVNQLSDKGHYPVASTLGYGKRLFDV